MSRPLHRATAVLTAWLVTLAVAGSVLGGPANADNPVTPGSFTGFGFDQCETQDQATMDRWLTHSPFFAVGIYISGKSRACREQRNLTPTWVATQLKRGWRLLPIALGPQASCNPRYPRHGDDPKIIPAPGTTGNYGAAREQGRQEAERSVADARRLGISRGSTLWYDLEAFDLTLTHCRESALRFLSGWVTRVKLLGYVSGVYSSAGSGIKMLDDARVAETPAITLPDYIWIARWDGVPNTSTPMVRDDGWQPHRRVKQFLGGHDETHGGVTVNIDRDFLDVGQGSQAGPTPRHCGGVKIDWWVYPILRVGERQDPVKVKALQCLLREKRLYDGRLHGVYDRATVRAARQWQASRNMTPTSTWGRRHWMSLLASGRWQLLKFGSTGPAVRRVQRTLNAAGVGRLNITGLFDTPTGRALRQWQRNVGHPVTGVATNQTWSLLVRGRSE
jgi:hypothetical protein